MARLIECVPNFSEGRDDSKINKIIASIKSVKGIVILDVDPGKDTNRTVVSIANSTILSIANKSMESAANQTVQKL